MPKKDLDVTTNIEKFDSDEKDSFIVKEAKDGKVEVELELEDSAIEQLELLSKHTGQSVDEIIEAALGNLIRAHNALLQEHDGDSSKITEQMIVDKASECLLEEKDKKETIDDVR